MKFKHSLILFLFLLLLLFIYLKTPNDNKDLMKLNEIVEKISQIEKLIQANKKNFELVKVALLEAQLNTDKLKDLKNLKEMLNLLQSQVNVSETKQNLRWNSNTYKICPTINLTKSNIDMSDLYDEIDFIDKDGGVWKQGFDINYSENDITNQKLKVFVVPHSHHDPGWIKTFNDYFYEDTKAILDNMLNFLTKEPKMKFIYAEIVYFEKWWNTLNENQKTQVKKLLDNKQLELVTGGWVMTDEATTHYFSMINQLTEGHLWLKTNLNYVPQSGWAIDPFGYSHVMPYILKKSNINNMVIQRVHYSVKKSLSLKKQLEFRWTQYWDSLNKYSIPCHLMPFFSYDVPHTCGPSPAVCCQFDFLRMFNYPCPWGKNPVEITNENIESRAKMLLDQYRKKSRLFDNGNVLLIPLGDDFRFKSENEWIVQFRNYNKLMEFMNNKKDWNVEIKFATLSEYFNAMTKEKLNSLPLLTGDMFSYADRLDHYWTGYFTSRPLLKVLDRLLMTNLRTAEIIYSLALVYHQKNKREPSNLFDKKFLIVKLDESRKAFSLNQHHDAITGTSKAHVALDFGNRLLHSINVTQTVFFQAAQSILQNNLGKNQLDEIIFDVDQIITSYNDPIKKVFVNLVSNSERYVYFFNSLAQPRQVFVHIPIEANPEFGIKIVGSGNQLIKCQLSPFIINEEPSDQMEHFVSFKLNIGPLAFEQVRLIVSNDFLSEQNCLSSDVKLYNSKNPIILSKNYKILRPDKSIGNYLTIENSLYKIYLNASTGYMESIQDNYSKTRHKTNILFKKYGAKSTSETSGAYIFVPDGDGNIIEPSEMNSIIHIQGHIFDEVIVTTKYLTHIVRLYNVDGMLANAIDIENIIDITHETNFEISMSIQTDFTNPSDYFYVDTNCFQFIRKRSFKKLPTQGNVYPMSCGAYLESIENNAVRKLSLFSKQANGVRGGMYIGSESSQSISFLEVFLDRILNQDDNRGLYEALVDNKMVSKHYRLVLEGWKEEKYTSAKLGHLTISGHQLLNDLNYPIHKMYVKSSFTNKIPTHFVGQKSLLTGFGFPCDYDMVNLKTNTNFGNPKLTIHRLKLNCKSGYISEGSCQITKRKSPLIKSMFDDLMIKYVDKFSLSGVHNIENHILPDAIQIDLMELDTFEVYFDF